MTPIRLYNPGFIREGIVQKEFHILLVFGAVLEAYLYSL
jgi:hypothetical protein